MRKLVHEGVGGHLCTRAGCNTAMSSDAKETISGVPSVGPHGSFKILMFRIGKITKQVESCGLQAVRRRAPPAAAAVPVANTGPWALGLGRAARGARGVRPGSAAASLKTCSELDHPQVPR